jgi:glyoxylase-like metal-dependent hydrolase (beta-lactamase superfamily II)
MNVPTTTLGDFELSILTDGNYYLDGGAFFGVVPKPLWERRMQPDAQNRLSVSMNSLLIRTGDKTILVETGAGNKLSEKMQRIYENQAKLLDSFAAAKVAPEDIDIVINSHLHFDHCGWNTVRQGDQIVSTFPKAKYYAQFGEWEHGSRQLERDRVSYLSPNYDPLIESKQMTLTYGDEEIAPGIRVQTFPGHTRSMQAIIIESKGQRACYISDLIPTTAHLEPTWLLSYDLFPLETIDNKKRFYEEAVPQNWLVVFTHDPKTPWAYLERDEKGKLVAKAV